MNLKTIGFSATLATTVTVGAALATTPAQAASIAQQTLSFVGSAKLEDIDDGSSGANLFKFNFFEYDSSLGTATIAPSSSPVFGPAGSSLTLKDLTLRLNGSETWSLFDGPVDNFITGLAESRTFRLTAFNLARASANTFEAVIDGFFLNPAATAADGSLTVQSRFIFDSNGSSYSADITAVPTPALLPGLIALGAGMLRKRKQEAVAQDEA